MHAGSYLNMAVIQIRQVATWEYFLAFAKPLFAPLTLWTRTVAKRVITWSVEMP